MVDKPRRVLMVEDNVNVLHLNRTVLERQGYTVYCAENLAQARALLQERPDIAILDIMLPDGSGLDFCGEVKSAVGCPVLMLTSKRGYEDIVEGLTGGADDYLTKPYRIEELTARIHALLRNGEKKPDKTLSKGALLLDIPSGRAFFRGEDLLLSPLEFYALLYLAQHEGSVVTPEALHDAVWRQPSHNGEGAVKTTVSRLRKKLVGSGYEIGVERGAGYCFRRSR